MADTTRVLVRGEAFYRHRRSGITRYAAELVAAFRADAGLGVEALTPYRWVVNQHLPSALPGTYRSLPLPGPLRGPVLTGLNARRAGRAGTVDVVHHTLDEPARVAEHPDAGHVCTVHDFTWELFPNVAHGVDDAIRAKAEMIAACDAVVCVSETTRADLARVHPGLDKPVVVAPHGVSERFARPRATRIDGLPERYVLHVGNRHAHKNVDLLLRAFAELASADPSLTLVLSGVGLPTEGERLAELGIADRTLRLRVGDDQLPWLYHRALAFVFPSRYEGFGLPVLEAMAAGCPVIVSETPALVEVAADAALTVPVDDLDALVSEAGRLVADADLRARLTKEGRRRASSFTWRRSAELTAAAYTHARRG